ncbi:sensor domain-containing diguanylate cyclase [Ramlibacter henchirensis]|nr:7TM-DISM domain-containing protein [Ramlibacter henchirensis]
MPRGLAARALRLAAATGLLLSFAAGGQQPAPEVQQRRTAGEVVLTDDAGSLSAGPLAQVWLDETGGAGIEQVLQPGVHFEPEQADTVHPLRPGAAVWMRLRLLRAEGEQRQWLLVFANPLLDEVSVWQMDDSGRWRVQTAGDRVPVDRWPEAGRYPVFRLELPAGQPREVYAQVRSAIRTSVPVRLSTDVAHNQRQQLEYLGLGSAFGALVLLIVACVAQGWAYRDRAWAGYAIYAGLSTLCVMAYTGVAGHLLWPSARAWADAAPGVLAFLSAGAAVLFVRDLTAVPARNRMLGRATGICGWLAVPLAPAYLLFERKLALDTLSVYLALVAALNVAVAWMAWRRRDVVGLWVLFAYVPLAAAVTAAMLRLLGWLPASFVAQYAVVAAIVLEVPLLLVALSIRSRERHGAHVREQALATQDALTGLIAQHLFQDQLQQVVSRFKHDREDAAIVFIDLVNHARIKAQHGQTVAEQSLLRSVIKLRRLVRDVDTVSRIGEARFALIMEGVRSRAVITDRAARLIAAGLMPLQGLKPEVTLQFHAAAVLLCENPVEAGELPEALGALLGSMSPRTRRPIRFLDPPDTQPIPIQTDTSGGPGSDSELLPASG